LLYLPGLYALWFRNSLQESGVSKPADPAPQHDSQTEPAFGLAEAAE
jgi:multidrug efflux pump